MDCSQFICNPYVLLPLQITIIIGQIIKIPIKTNVNVKWMVSNKNVLFNKIHF